MFFSVAIIGKKFEGQTDKKEQWYGTDYKIESIPQATLEVRTILFTRFVLWLIS